MKGKNDKGVILPKDVIDYLFINDMLMTNVKTQKLIYFVFAEAFRKNILKIEDYENNLFQAWKNGPVNLDSYKRFFDLYNVDDEEIISFRNNPLINNKNDNKELIKLIEKLYIVIFNMYKDDVINRSHEEIGWKNARKGVKDGEISTKEIENNDLLNGLPLSNGDTDNK